MSSLEYWRGVFGGTEASIFEVIERAVAVAAADFPDKLVGRRDGIVQSLYGFTSVSGGRRASKEEEEESGIRGRDAASCCSSGGGTTAGQKREEEADDKLLDSIDDEATLIDEVLRIKNVLDDKNHEEYESSLFESLRRLQLMELTIPTLMVTDVENSVRRVEGHGSARVRQLARVLLDGWVELWGDSTNISEVATDAPDAAANSSDDQWRDFPPLDEGALRAIYGPPIPFDELFSKKPGKTGKFERDEVKRADEAREEERKHENDSENLKPTCEKDGAGAKRKREDAVDQSETMSRSAEPHDVPTKRFRIINSRLKTSGKDLKKCLEMRNKDSCELANEPPAAAKNAPKQCPIDDMLIEEKLEASRMRIREGYNQANDKKNQRRIRLLDLRDIPKPVESMKSSKMASRRDRGFFNRFRR